MPVLGINSSTPVKEIFLAKSQTWTAPFSGQALVTVVGGGGQGGAKGDSDNTPCLVATGGGAGGCAQSVLNIVGGVGYTVTIGAGGRNATLQTPSTSTHGTSGGNSSFAGTGITTLTGNGGTGGRYGYVATGNPATMIIDPIAGAVGGSASGGNVFNATGGAGGYVLSPFGGGSVTSVTGFIATGGGGVGVQGATGGRGGNITFELTGTPTLNLATGGGGAIGNGGDITSVGITGNQYAASGGGMGWTDSPDNADQPPHPSGGHGISYGAFRLNIDSVKYYYQSTGYAADFRYGRNFDTYAGGNLPFGAAISTSAQIPGVGGYLATDWGYPGYGIHDGNGSVAAGEAYGHHGGGGASCGNAGGGYYCRAGNSYGMGGGGGCAQLDTVGTQLSYAGASKFGGGSGGITFDTDQQPYGTWNGGGPGLVLVQYLTIEA